MKLSVLDRIALLDLLPATGDYTTIRVSHDLRALLSFSEEEHATLKFKQTDGGGMIWENDFEREFEFGPKATALIVEALEKASKEKKLNADHLRVYEMFMEAA